MHATAERHPPTGWQVFPLTQVPDPTSPNLAGFPLTQVPNEYRALLKQGLVITYAINAAAAVYSRGIASAKQEPVGFWFGKTFLLGGLALGELREIETSPEKRKNFPNQK